ncbi:hypothetical protein FBU30_007397 [Linnemannia zychae]|nr:hypothetical protein FBU30_007397 [Linnemannia zychae]
MPSTGIGKYFAWSVSKETGFMFGSALMTTTSSVNQSNPPLLTGSCMVSAYGGNKLVIFGGSSDTARATGNIYIYDTIKYNWTTGTISLKPRADMACATSGDYFVVWGGYDNEAPANIPTEMLFYNMKTDKWANQTNISPEPGSVPDDNNDPVRSTKNNAPAIGGGVASVVLIAIIVGIVIIRRNRQQKRAEAARRHPQDSMSDSIIPPLPQPIRAESDASLLIAKISPDLNIPNAPHTSPSPTKISSSPHTALHHQVYEFTTERGPREEIELITRPQDPQYIPPPITSSLASLPRIETQSATSQPLQSPPLSAPQLYDISRPLDELPQVWLQPFNDPQYVEPPPPSTLLRTLDYARIQQEFPQPPLIANPQTSGPSSMRLINPLDRIAQVQEKYQRDLERLRKEQMAELEGIRKRWEDQKSRQVE